MICVPAAKPAGSMKALSSTVDQLADVPMQIGNAHSRNRTTVSGIVVDASPAGAGGTGCPSIQLFLLTWLQRTKLLLRAFGLCRFCCLLETG